MIDAAIPYAKPLAEKFARENKDERVIYVMGSGPSQQVAYTFSSFILMEMQWVDSASFSAGEFFHGPFELVEKGKPFMLLMNDGNTRPMDVRALEFLNRFDAKTTVVDAKDYGLGNEIPASVKDYFNPILLDGVLRVYGEAIAEARKHPLTQRRYMCDVYKRQIKRRAAYEKNGISVGGGSIGGMHSDGVRWNNRCGPGGNGSS